MSQTIWEGPGIDAWRPWRPEEAAAYLADVTAPWCVVGGWALDLWRGTQLRDHDDLEIAVPRQYFPLLRETFSGFKIFAVGDGEVRALAPGAEPAPEIHQNWVLDEGAGAWRMDIFLEPGDAATWVYRRDQMIRLPRPEMVAISADGVPYLKPEGVLLYKAKIHREKDDADFISAVPHMDLSARAWLRGMLGHLHPGHPWIDRLA